MQLHSVPTPIAELTERYVTRLQLEQYPLKVTCDKRLFESWLGRKVSSSIGGAYIYDVRSQHHLILIYPRRIDLSQQNALEIVVAEELLHMRHWIDGDRRRHSRHGYDRIAVQVADLVGCSLDEIRSCLIPIRRQRYKYLYRCPSCGREIPRKRTGVWSCSSCSPTFNRKYVLELVAMLSETNS